MKFATGFARKGVVTAVVVFFVAFATGHIMQTVLAEQDTQSGDTPLVPKPPKEALVPVVLETPPAPRLPETFG